MLDSETASRISVSEQEIGPWYKDLNAGHWRILMACFCGWVFDGYENYALFLVAAPALRQLLPPDQLLKVSLYQGIIGGARRLRGDEGAGEKHDAADLMQDREHGRGAARERG